MLFTEDEINKLQTEVNNLSNDYNMDIAIVNAVIPISSKSKICRRFWTKWRFWAGDNYDGIFILIDMDTEKPIYPPGIGIRHLTDAA